MYYPLLDLSLYIGLRMGAISQVSGKQDTGLPWEAQGQDGDAPVLKTLFYAYLNFSLQVSVTIHVHVSAYGHTCMSMCECGQVRWLVSSNITLHPQF